MKIQLACGLVVFAALAGPAALGAETLAQAWPSRPVRLVSPFPPGGTNDTVARIIAGKLGENAAQPVVVENRAGAGGMIGSDFVAKSAPDGYTLLMSTPGPITINRSLFAKLPYDADKDFTPISRVADVPQIVVVHPSVPARSIAELIALAKANPGGINFAVVGNGSTTHLAGELFKSMAGIDMVAVPYNGSAPALTDLLGGQTQVMFDIIVSALPHVKSGKLRGLAVTGGKRSRSVPDLPTVAEAGLPGYEVLTWYGILAPGGLPADLAIRINREIVRVLQAPEVQQKLSSQGVDLVGSSQEEFAAYLKAESAKWAKVIRQSGAPLQ